LVGKEFQGQAAGIHQIRVGAGEQFGTESGDLAEARVGVLDRAAGCRDEQHRRALFDGQESLRSSRSASLRAVMS
jgi:hypothetical protein